MKKTLLNLLPGANVTDDPAVLSQFTSCDGFVSGFIPFCKADIENKEQLSKLVTWANETKTPLIPVSSREKHRHGGTVPAIPGAVMVDLSGMKKVLSVNRVMRMAVIEPGVTYSQLQAELKKEGLMIDTSLAPRAEKSVLASLLETESRLNPNCQWSSIEPLRCTEVTWGDGVTMLTGDAANGPPDLEKQHKLENWQINSGGPDRLDYIRFLTGAQGTTGIVTWASIRCAILPDVHEQRIVASDDFNKLIDFLYSLTRIRFSDSMYILSASAFAALMGCDTKGLPAYICLISAAGRPVLGAERADAHIKYFERSAQSLGLSCLSSISGLKGEDIMERAFSPCKEGAYWKDSPYGAAADVFFQTTLERVPIYTDIAYKLADKMGFPATDLGVYVQPRHQGVNVHCEFILFYDPQNSEKAKSFFDALAPALAHEDAYFYRPYGDWARLQLNKDAASASVMTRLKNVFDPNGIMNPGRLCL